MTLKCSHIVFYFDCFRFVSGNIGEHLMLTQLSISARFMQRSLSCLLRPFVALLAIAFIIPSPAHAEDAAIRLATRLTLPPYVQNGATTGIEVEIIKAVFEKTGHKIKFEQMNRIQMIKQFDDGNIDGILTQNITASNVGCATDWYLVHQNVAFTLADTGINIASVADLTTMAVVSFDGAQKYIGGEFQTAVKDNENYREVAEQSDHIGLLYSGQFDAIVGDEWIIRYAQRQLFEATGEYRELRVHHILKPSLYSARFHNPKVCETFNTALQSLKHSGEYDNLVENYHQSILVAARAGQPHQ